MKKQQKKESNTTTHLNSLTSFLRQGYYKPFFLKSQILDGVL